MSAALTPDDDFRAFLARRRVEAKTRLDELNRQAEAMERTFAKELRDLDDRQARARRVMSKKIGAAMTEWLDLQDEALT